MMLERNHYLSRREIVLGTAAGAILLAPFLRARKLEAANSNPKRLVLLFTPDSHPPEWWPTGSGTTFTLNEPLADFRGLESNLLFIQRLDHAWTYDNHHEAGPPQLFTGARWVSDSERYANGPSIDQILLKNTDIRGGTPLASVHLSSAGGAGIGVRHSICYSGPGQAMSNIDNASRAFSNIFNGVTFDAMAPLALQDGAEAARRRMLLDLNTAELRRIQTFLGQEERAKLELHVESLLELSRQIPTGGTGGTTGTGGSSAGTATGGNGTGGSPTVVGGRCERVDTTGVSSNPRDATVTTKQAQTMADILVNAFTCDRTRVASFGMSFSGGHHEGLLGFTTSWHDNVAHISRTNDSVSVGGQAMTTRQAFITFDRYWAGQVAYLAKRLASIAEGSGTMLDNTLMVWGVESGTNHNHSPRDMQ
jgi:hypothetical protein